MITYKDQEDLLVYLDTLDDCPGMVDPKVVSRKLRKLLDLEYVRCNVCKKSTGKLDGTVTNCGYEECLAALCETCKLTTSLIYPNMPVCPECLTAEQEQPGMHE